MTRVSDLPSAAWPPLAVSTAVSAGVLGASGDAGPFICQVKAPDPDPAVALRAVAADDRQLLETHGPATAALGGTGRDAHGASPIGERE
jgi:hypothetical protein